jgi:putative transposase
MKQQMHIDCSYRYRFYPTPEQAELLNRTFGCIRVVYNRARELREATWKERKEFCGFLKTNAMLTVLKKDMEFVWLNEVSCVPLQQSLRHLDAAYQAFFRELKKPKGQRRKIGYPGFRSKHGAQSAEFTRSGFNYRDGVLKLAKMVEPLNVVWSRTLPEPPSTVTVIREADNRWYIACRINRHVEPLTGGDQVGIDLGLTHFATLSTGEKIDNPRHLGRRLKRLARLQRRASRKQKGSKNRAKANLKVARAHSAVRHARQDFLHKLSTRLIRENQTICVENLCVSGMLKAKLHSRSISDAGWGGFLRMLAYKSGWYGRQLVKIDRWFPSTKTCGECGTTGHILSLDDRRWTCPDCGTVHDRDVNAARNVLTAGLAAVNACGGDIRPVAA